MSMRQLSLIYAIVLLSLMTMFAYGLPNKQSINPPPSVLKNKRQSLPPPVAQDIPKNGNQRIQIEKRNLQALSSNGVANTALYKKHMKQSLGKIKRGAHAFQLNTGKTLGNLVAPILSLADPGPVVRPSGGAVPPTQPGPSSGQVNPAPPSPSPPSPAPSSPPPPSLKSDATGTDALTGDGNILWQGTIEVGTPPSDFTVDFDTGSSDLFLAGPACTSGCQGHKIYNPSTSTTSSALGLNFTLNYGDGSSVSGSQFNDTVGLAGINVQSQTLGAASVYAGFGIDSFPPDGVLGMGFKAISGYPATPFFANLVASGSLSAPIFAFKLSTVAGESELSIGSVNENLFKQDTLAYTNVTVPGYWQIVIDSVNVNGNSIGKALSGIVDTGTTTLAGDPTTVSKIYSEIPGAADASTTVGAGFFTYPCNTTSVISLTLGQQTFNISQDTLNLGQVDANDPNTCVGGLVGSDSGVGWIIGDVFLRNTYTIFDFGGERVGFANLS